MANYLHHAVIAKAKKNGITMVSTGHGIFVATLADGSKYEGETKDATAWLDGVLKAQKAADKATVQGVMKRAGFKPRKAAGLTRGKSRDEDEDEETDEDGDDAADALEGNEDDEEEAEGSIVKGKYKAKYAEVPGALKGSCGDDMAAALKELTDKDGEMDLGKLRQVAIENKVNWSKYAGLANNGQKRMVIGNILRGLLRKGLDVRIGTQLFKGFKQPD